MNDEKDAKCAPNASGRQRGGMDKPMNNELSRTRPLIIHRSSFITSLTLPAPAKLNLFLHVTGRRRDGYHELQTVFRLLVFEDTVHLSRRRDGELRMARPTPGVAPDDDLALAAARALQKETGCSLGAEIRIDKRIPAGAGLGGGSSNAASVLKGLNTLWELGLDDARLARIGVELGADIPVFLRGRDAWAEGVGEKLTPLRLPPAWYLLVFPPLSISTAGIFSDPDLKRDRAPLTPDAWRADPAQAVNDCEPVVLNRHPEMADIKHELEKHGPARMSGTGSTFFLAFPDFKSARAVGIALGSRYNIALTPARGC